MNASEASRKIFINIVKNCILLLQKHIISSNYLKKNYFGQIIAPHFEYWGGGGGTLTPGSYAYVRE